MIRVGLTLTSTVHHPSMIEDSVGVKPTRLHIKGLTQQEGRRPSWLHI